MIYLCRSNHAHLVWQHSLKNVLCCILINRNLLCLFWQRSPAKVKSISLPIAQGNNNEINQALCVCVCVWCLRVHVCQREFKRAIFYENELMPFFLGIKWFQGLSLELQRQTLMSPNQLCKVTRPNQEFRAQLLCSIWPSLKHNIRCSLISIMPISPTQ